MKTQFLRILILLLTTITLSCQVTDLEPEESPNSLRQDQFSEDLFIVSLEKGLADYFESATDFGMQTTRMLHMFGPLYDNAFSPSGFDPTWTNAYSAVLADAQAVKKAALPKDGFQHLGIAKITEAYVLMTLVDYFGDVPYEEAFLGAENLNPNVTSGAAIYESARVLLNEAIQHLNNASAAKIEVESDVDLIYGGDFDKWIAFANTLKLRLFLNKKLIDATADDSIAVLLTRNIIDSPDESFQFNYSTTLSNPDSRHPEFGANYDNGASDYMSNYFMNLLRTDYGLTDPRVRYYFYRQVKTNTADPNELDCIGTTPPSHYGPNDPYCQLPAGYWGRDHGDNDGIPPDNLKRTIWGIYPIGGKFDRNAAGAGSQTAGAKGAGISPIMMDFYVDFMRAEAALMGTGEDARTLLEEAVTGSIEKVMDFPAEVGYTMQTADLAVVPSSSAVDNYVDAVLTRYDAAASDEERLEVISREYFKAAMGNGFEVYNMYRRTGYPADLQPTLEPSPGVFIRSFVYPSNFVNRNSSVDQKPGLGTDVKVFWDNGSKSLD